MQLWLFFVLLVSSAHSSPFSSDCPNGISPRDAQKCSDTLLSYANRLEDIEEEDVLSANTISMMRGMCSTFRNCYTQQKLCSLYDRNVANQMDSSCQLYEIMARDRNRQCSQSIARANSIQCLNSVVESILNGEQVVPDGDRVVQRVGSQGCADFWSKIQCASQEVKTLCSRDSADELERFMYTKGQQQDC